MAKRIESFRDLVVYQKAFSLQQIIFETTKSFPKEELFSLTDQIRRASRSIGSNIAEAWHKRLYIAHFVSKLTDSDGEQAETQHWIHTAYQCKYISTEKRTDLVNRCTEVGRILGSMISNPEKFCRYQKK
jgi:four helix bundle protein